jgi:hypothetical protein
MWLENSGLLERNAIRSSFSGDYADAPGHVRAASACPAKSPRPEPVGILNWRGWLVAELFGQAQATDQSRT